MLPPSSAARSRSWWQPSPSAWCAVLRRSRRPTPPSPPPRTLPTPGRSRTSRTHAAHLASVCSHTSRSDSVPARQGIDEAHVRRVIHLGASKSIESYSQAPRTLHLAPCAARPPARLTLVAVPPLRCILHLCLACVTRQEFGRAGRDGKPATVTLFMKRAQLARLQGPSFNNGEQASLTFRRTACTACRPLPPCLRVASTWAVPCVADGFTRTIH